jgi:hypothetical protein
MPYPKFKNENYQNLGGINQKASPFMTGANEALALLNWDFSRPGAYTQRPGTTQYIGGGGSACLSFFEFSRLSGASWKIFNQGNQLYSFNGATSLLRTMGVTFSFFSITLSAIDYRFIPSTQNTLDFASFVDRCFVAGSNFDFFKTDGTKSYKFGMPPNIGNIGFLQTTGGGAGWTGWFQYSVAAVNDRGAIGPVMPIPPGSTTLFDSQLGPGVFNIALAGATSLRIDLPNWNAQYLGSQNNLTDQYGITAVAIFRAGPYAADAAGSGPTFIGELRYLTTVGLSTSTFFDYGSTVGSLYSTGFTPASFDWFTLIPRYINVFNNALFLAGFSTLPSTVYFSKLGEPETIDSTASLEVRNNDGDRLTGMINYRQAQIFSKLHSMHYLTGFSSDDYALNELTDQYGCLSQRAMCVWQDRLWFLDSNGVAEYNGGRVATVSNRVEQTFRRMNVQAAIDQAVMLHVKDRNEIWTAFPIDGATKNNYLVVYDYVADAWTEWQGPQCASLALATGPSLLQQPFYGDYSGSIHYFDPIFYSDSGRAFTCSITSRFYGDLGYSVTKQFRRLFFDMTMQQAAGLTHLMYVKLFSDMNTNAVAFSTTFAISSSLPQQNRIEFGVPAKTLAMHLDYIAQDSALQFSGFTVEYRFQRAV